MAHHVVNIYTASIFILIITLSSCKLPEKILCADKECKTRISKAKGQVRYLAPLHGMISFNRGEQIEIYSKECDTEKNAGIWGIKVNGKFGYAPSSMMTESSIDVNPSFCVTVNKPDNVTPEEKNQESITPTPASELNENTVSKDISQPVKKDNELEVQQISEETTLNVNTESVKEPPMSGQDGPSLPTDNTGAVHQEFQATETPALDLQSSQFTSPSPAVVNPVDKETETVADGNSVTRDNTVYLITNGKEISIDEITPVTSVGENTPITASGLPFQPTPAVDERNFESETSFNQESKPFSSDVKIDSSLPVQQGNVYKKLFDNDKLHQEAASVDKTDDLSSAVDATISSQQFENTINPQESQVPSIEESNNSKNVFNEETKENISPVLETQVPVNTNNEENKLSETDKDLVDTQSSQTTPDLQPSQSTLLQTAASVETTSVIPDDSTESLNADSIGSTDFNISPSSATSEVSSSTDVPLNQDAETVEVLSDNLNSTDDGAKNGEEKQVNEAVLDETNNKGEDLQLDLNEEKNLNESIKEDSDVVESNNTDQFQDDKTSEDLEINDDNEEIQNVDDENDDIGNFDENKEENENSEEISDKNDGNIEDDAVDEYENDYAEDPENIDEPDDSAAPRPEQDEILDNTTENSDNVDEQTSETVDSTDKSTVSEEINSQDQEMKDAAEKSDNDETVEKIESEESLNSDDGKEKSDEDDSQYFGWFSGLKNAILGSDDSKEPEDQSSEASNVDQSATPEVEISTNSESIDEQKAQSSNSDASSVESPDSQTISNNNPESLTLTNNAESDSPSSNQPDTNKDELNNSADDKIESVDENVVSESKDSGIDQESMSSDGIEKTTHENNLDNSAQFINDNVESNDSKVDSMSDKHDGAPSESGSVSEDLQQLKRENNIENDFKNYMYRQHLDRQKKDEDQKDVTSDKNSADIEKNEVKDNNLNAEINKPDVENEDLASHQPTVTDPKSDTDENKSLEEDAQNVASDENSKNKEVKLEETMTEEANNVKDQPSEAGDLKPSVQGIIETLPEWLQVSAGNFENQGISSRVVFITVITGIFVTIFLIAIYAAKTRSAEFSLAVKLCHLDQKLFAVTTEKNIIKEELDHAKDKVINLETTLIDSEECVSPLQGELEELKSTCAEQKDTISSLEEELGNATEAGLELNKMLSELLSSQTHNDSMQGSIEALQEQLNSQQANVSVLSEDLDKKNSENKEIKSKIDVIIKQNESLTNENNNLLKENEHIKTCYENFKEKYEKKSEEHDRFEIENNSLKRNLEDSEIQVDSLSTKISSLEGKTESLEKEVIEKNAEILILKETIRDIDICPSKDFTDSSSEERDDIMQKLLDMAKIKASLKTLTEEKELLNIKYKAEIDARKELEDKLMVMKNQYDEMEKNLKDSVQVKSDAENRLEILSKYFKEKEAQLQKELGLQEAKVQQSTETAENADIKAAEVEQNVSLYKSQFDTLKKELEEMERSYKNQIAVQEKKAHENWLAARAAERKLEDVKADSGILRNKLTLVEQEKASLLASVPNDSILKPKPQKVVGQNGNLYTSQESATSESALNAPSPVSQNSTSEFSGLESPRGNGRFVPLERSGLPPMPFPPPPMGMPMFDDRGPLPPLGMHPSMLPPPPPMMPPFDTRSPPPFERRSQGRMTPDRSKRPISPSRDRNSPYSDREPLSPRGRDRLSPVMDRRNGSMRGHTSPFSDHDRRPRSPTFNRNRRSPNRYDSRDKSPSFRDPQFSKYDRLNSDRPNLSMDSEDRRTRYSPDYVPSRHPSKPPPMVQREMTAKQVADRKSSSPQLPTNSSASNV